MDTSLHIGGLAEAAHLAPIEEVSLHFVPGSQMYDSSESGIGSSM